MAFRQSSISIALILLMATVCFADSTGRTSDKTGAPTAPTAAELGIVFNPNSSTTLVVQRDGVSYLVDLAAKTVTPIETAAQQDTSSSTAQKNAQAAPATASPDNTRAGVYKAGDDRLFTLPTGRRLERGGVYFNFTHRFPYEPAFHDPARGHTLLGLDDFAVPSFGFTYGVTSRLSVSAFRSPSIIARPIQLMAAYHLLDENDGQPFNAQFRFSVEGQNDFQRNFITNFELIASRSITSRAQIYFVPTVSLHNRPVLGQGSIVQAPPYQPCSAATAAGSAPLTGVRPCADTVALGFGLSVDVRPSVALIGEVDPTVVNADELGIHRPAYSFAIQKKIWRHAFTLGFTNGVGVTVAQRSATRSVYLRNPSADKPSGLFIGFDLTRQIR